MTDDYDCAVDAVNGGVYLTGEEAADHDRRIFTMLRLQNDAINMHEARIQALEGHIKTRMKYAVADLAFSIISLVVLLYALAVLKAQ